MTKVQIKDHTQKCTMGSPKMKKRETYNLNPSLVGQSKSSKEMGKTSSLKKVYSIATTIV
jgi:hypothetical protein